MFINFVRNIYYNLRNLPYKNKYLKSKHPDIDENGILFIGHDLERRGAEKLLYNIIKWFRSKGIPICVITFAYGPMWKEYQDVGPLIITSKKNISREIKKISGYKYAICNTVTVGDVIPTLKDNGYRVISLIHEMENVVRLGHTNSAYAVINYADEVIFPSSYVAESFGKIINIEKKSIIVHNQGLFNISEKKASEQEVMSFKKKYSIPDNHRIVLNVATASKRKGFDIFLETAIASQGDDLTFVWVGDNTHIILQHILRKKGIKEISNLKLLGYISNLEELNNAYACADVFYLTSREDPFPSVVLDALSAGTPVVAFKNCGGFVDVLRSGETGIILETQDPLNAVRKIKELLDSPNYSNICANCMAEVKKHSFDDYCEMLHRLLLYNNGRCEIERIFDKNKDDAIK